MEYVDSGSYRPSDAGCPSYLFVLPWGLDGVGGVTQVVVNLARTMASVGVFHPIVLIIDWECDRPRSESFEGLQTIRWRIRANGEHMGLFERVKYLIWARNFAPRFAKFLRVNRVVAVNVHYAGPSVFSLAEMLSKVRHDVPFIVSFHGADLTEIQRCSSLSRWSRLLNGRALPVACSQNLAKRVQVSFGLKLPVAVVHNGLEASTFIATEQSSRRIQGKYILSVAKFEKKKGLDVLIRAFAQTIKEFPDRKLVLVGADAAELEPLRSLCKSENIADAVEFLVDVPHREVSSLFKDAELFVLPSRCEPFGIVLLEAGAWKLPVVATRVGGVPEVIEDGVNGLLVNPDDVTELACAIRALLSQPGRARQLGEHLDRRVRENFSWTRACSGYLELIGFPSTG